MRFLVPLMLVTATAAAEPAPKVTVKLLDVQTKDANHYLVTSAKDVDALAARASELQACTKDFAIDIAKPSRAILHYVSLDVAEDGKVVKVVPEKFPGPNQDCIANVVQGWTFGVHGDVLVRIGMVPPVKANPKLPAGYVAALHAVCDAKGATLEESVANVRAALDKFPDKRVRELVTTLGEHFPSERDPLLRGVLANAGIETCGLVAH